MVPSPRACAGVTARRVWSLRRRDGGRGAFVWRVWLPATRRSSDDREQPVPPHRPRPAPERPAALALMDREENDLGAADDVLERHEADLRGAAVLRVVAVVAHHEIIAGRHLVDAG